MLRKKTFNGLTHLLFKCYQFERQHFCFVMKILPSFFKMKIKDENVLDISYTPIHIYLTTLCT